MFRRVAWIFVLAAIALISTSAAGAACLATGKPCSNDLQCCPGMVCGWGSVCQAGCKISGVFYPPNTVNPNNACQICNASVSRNQWSNRPSGTACGSQSNSTCDHPDTCSSSGQCLANLAANGTTCSDGSACTQTDTCQSGACVGANPVVCTAQNQCHDVGTCNPATGVCSNPRRPDGSTCSDGNACTRTDACSYGNCVGSSPVTCAAQDQCHTAGTCNPATGVCSNPAVPDGAPCDDDNVCTSDDACDAGACGGESATCGPAPACATLLGCFPEVGCVYETTPEAACDDGDPCTTGDDCATGRCTGDPVVCADVACHQASFCSGGDCFPGPALPDGTPCDDEDACTTPDACSAGSCAGTPVTCTALDSCHLAGTCDPATGECSDPVRPNGSTCDDEEVCSQVDVCDTGVCGACLEDPSASPRFVDNGDGTITDRKTCLVWEKKTGSLPGLLSDPHNVNNRYTWSSASVAFLAYLNTAEQFAGHSDWRLPYTPGAPTFGAPYPAEIESILIPSCPVPPCIAPIFGPTAPVNYWTAVTTGPRSFVGRFGVGDVSSDDVNALDAARAVRGGHCYNVRKDECETGVDCGAGSGCLLCEGESCTAPEECQRGSCYNGTCGQAPTCSDGVKNGDETDTDCGGSTCSGCVVGRACGDGTDCLSGLCDAGHCVTCLPTPVSCTLGTQCCDGYCSNGSCASCMQPGGACGQDVDCCAAYCSGGQCSTCRAANDDCTSGIECCTGYCVSGSCGACVDDGYFCVENQECCSGYCQPGEQRCANTLTPARLPGEPVDEVRKQNKPPKKFQQPAN